MFKRFRWHVGCSAGKALIFYASVFDHGDIVLIYGEMNKGVPS